jgi:hypothetical protein
LRISWALAAFATISNATMHTIQILELAARSLSSIDERHL